MSRALLRAVALFTAAAAALVLAQGCVASTEAPSEDALGEVDQTVTSTPPMTRGQILGLAASVPGYSYWWGHGAWDTASKKFPGKCSGSCGKCSHSATKGGPEYGADCSGFVAQAWQVPTKGNVSTDRHPYGTGDFRWKKIHWKPIKRSELKPGDALVYNSGGKGHIVLFESWTKAGKAIVYECAGCKTGCVHRARSIGKKYIAIRRNGLEKEDDAGTDAGTAEDSGSTPTQDGSVPLPKPKPPVSNLPCTELYQSMGWKSKQCEKDGNNACGGKGIKTPDCDVCCGSTCVMDSQCGSGQMCAYDGFKKCCQAKGKSGQKCFDTSQCPAGQVCMPENGEGSPFVCASPACLDD